MVHTQRQPDSDESGQLRLRTRRHGDRAVLSVSGDVDAVSRVPLTQAVADALADGVHALTIDVHDVVHCDSSGLSTFLGVQRTARAEGKHVALVNIPPRLHLSLTLTGLLDVLTEPGPPGTRSN